MVLAHLNDEVPQIRTKHALAHLNEIYQVGEVSKLAELVTEGTLESHLKVFLLTCQLNSLSPMNIMDYSQNIGAIVLFCKKAGIV